MKKANEEKHIGYTDKHGRRHVGWRSNNQPATEIEQVTGWSYAPGHEPNHKKRNDGGSAK